MLLTEENLENKQRTYTLVDNFNFLIVSFEYLFSTIVGSLCLEYNENHPRAKHPQKNLMQSNNYVTYDLIRQYNRSRVALFIINSDIYKKKTNGKKR